MSQFMRYTCNAGVLPVIKAALMPWATRLLIRNARRVVARRRWCCCVGQPPCCLRSRPIPLSRRLRSGARRRGSRSGIRSPADRVAPTPTAPFCNALSVAAP